MNWYWVDTAWFLVGLMLMAVLRLLNLQSKSKSLAYDPETLTDLSLAESGSRAQMRFPDLAQIMHQNQSKAANIRNQAQRVFGLQIGINYICTRKSLQGCINDALNLRSYLMANEVPLSNLTYYSDFTNPKPTKSNVLRAIQDTLRKASANTQSDSTTLISFSGHGTHYGLFHETWCALAANDVSLELIVDTELWDTVAPIMAQNPRSRLTIISDSCFSENMANLQYTYYPDKSNTQVLMKRQESFHAIPSTVFLISGSTKGQTAADFEAKNSISHGALTWTLLMYLQEHRLESFTYEQFILGVNRLLRAHKFSQTSCFSSSVPLSLKQTMEFP